MGITLHKSDSLAMCRAAKADVVQLAQAATDAKDNEAGLLVMLKLMLIFGDAERALNVPKISRYRFEFPVRGGRIDLLLFHRDGGVTVVEVKTSETTRNVVGGIGQLCWYAAVLPVALKKTTQPSYIRRLLVAPTDEAQSTAVISACELAGVQFTSMANFKLFRGLLESKLSRNGL